MIHCIKVCGIFGVLILYAFVVLAIVSILVACLAKRRRAMAVLAMVALLPLGFGLMGTALGYSKVASYRELIEEPDAAVMQHGKSEARCTTYLGLGCTLLLWVIYGIGVVAKTRDDSIRRSTGT